MPDAPLLPREHPGNGGMAELVEGVRAWAADRGQARAQLDALVAETRRLADEVRRGREADAMARQALAERVATLGDNLAELGRVMSTGLGAVEDALDSVSRDGDLRGQLVREQVSHHHTVMQSALATAADGIRADTRTAVAEARASSGWTAETRVLVATLLGIVGVLVFALFSVYAESKGHDGQGALRTGGEVMHGVAEEADP